MIDTDKAAKALEKFADGPAQNAADSLAQSFEQASDRIAKSLERAALSGEFSFRNLAASIAQDFARNAIQDLLISPLENALLGSGKSGGSSGGQKPSPVNIVMNVNGVSDSQGFQKNQGQISASLARAVAQGQKFI